MTDTANAPERIWTADTTGNCSVGFNTPSLDYKNEYISRTHCDELVAAAKADLAEAQAKIARLTNALEEIADRHIPDQPAALDISEAEYVRRQHTELRRTARATLAEVRRFAGAALQENANE